MSRTTGVWARSPRATAAVLLTLASACAPKTYLLSHQAPPATGVAVSTLGDSARSWLGSLGWVVDSIYQPPPFDGSVNAVRATKQHESEVMVLVAVVRWPLVGQSLPQLHVAVDDYRMEGGNAGEHLPASAVAKAEAAQVMELLRLRLFKAGG